MKQPVQMGIAMIIYFLGVVGAWIFFTIGQPVGAAGENFQIYLPYVVIKPTLGLYGQVTYAGNPISNIPLELRWYNGAAWDTLETTTTDATGQYSFPNPPSLVPTHAYFVRFTNEAENPLYLWYWETQVIESYTSGSEFPLGNFDLANVPLLMPGNNQFINLPYIFQWTPRPATPSDIYELHIYDPNDDNPHIYTDPLPGYVGGFNVTDLPPDFLPGTQYAWAIWVYSPDGGLGFSYEERYVRFANTTLASDPLLWQTSTSSAFPNPLNEIPIR